uniref:Uncharacterized protein n=1 Tax=Romanomermis culicivorax TaxID=13658 RepID=A0A915JIS7_ROMCU
MSIQTPLDEYILGSKYISQNVYGSMTTTTGGKNKEQAPTSSNKDDSALTSNKTANSSVLVVEQHSKPPAPNFVIEESDESDYVVEINDEFSSKIEEENLAVQHSSRTLVSMPLLALVLTFMKAHKATLVKDHFPYEYLAAFDKLDEHQLPP